MKTSLADVGKLALCVLTCELAGIIGSFFSISAIPAWYSGLVKPALNPPSWVFGPVWTILYALMGIAVFLVLRRGWRQKGVKVALGIFAAQLLANALWSILFFGMRNPLYALIDILVLWVLVLVTILVFYRLSRPAAYLLLPYIAWVSFATYLNYMIYILN